ncbi:DNA-binding response regulator [Cohnella sp. 56]|uniref:DNA-binding response regulator n=1 Tax=Cohnella sp. 56 TaxID=3113722 RepID=UPI0030EA5387
MTIDRSFDTAYKAMMEKAIRNSKGERKRRLKEVDRFNERLALENVWWPAIGNLDHVHPEYEVVDYNGVIRFVDNAYVPPGCYRGLFVESDAYGTHLRDVSRFRFGDNLERQNLLLIDGWHMLRFGRDDMLEKPKRCQQTLLAAMTAWGYGGGGSANSIELSMQERAILHWCGKQRRSIKVREVMVALKIGYAAASKGLQDLGDRGFIQANRTLGGKTTSYTVLPKLFKHQL